MTEDDARQVLLLQSREQPAGAAPTPDAAAMNWTPEDRAWATRQALAEVGAVAAPEAFVVARARLAMPRLLARDEAARRWLQQRPWHPGWVLAAAAAGLLAGALADQLGPPQRVNLLAPAVWAVVLWNLVVYGLMLLWTWRRAASPRRADVRSTHATPTVPAANAAGPASLTLAPTASTPAASVAQPGGALAWLLRRLPGGLGGARDEPAQRLCWPLLAPLQARRLALLAHTAAAALGLALVAGLYARGLVLDYRAGWQSTFLDAPQVQGLLGLLLAPGSALTGIPLPDVAPLRVGPAGDAVASAAPWIHLYAATLVLAVLLPRGLLAWQAGWRARRLSQRLPLRLDTPYFEALHPLMRPDLPPQLRLLWPGENPPCVLMGQPVGQPLGRPGAGAEATELLRSPEGDVLQLRPVAAGGPPAPPPAGWWQRLRGVAPADPLQALRRQVDAVLWVARDGQPLPDWLRALQRPLLVWPEAGASPRLPDALPAAMLPTTAAPRLGAAALLQALALVLPDDPRRLRLQAAWAAQQRQLCESLADEVTGTLARIACSREPVPDALLGRKSDDLDAARQTLLQRLQAEWQAHAQRLQGLLAPAVGAAPDPAPALAPLDIHPAQALLRTRIDEGKAAIVGGMLSGALAGLKADALSGGLTMGAGALTGGVLGALGAAGAARGANSLRGTPRSHLEWPDELLQALADALLRHAVASAWPDEASASTEAMTPELLTAWQAALADRPAGPDIGAHSAAFATALRPAVRQALCHAVSTRSPPQRRPASAVRSSTPP